jgi:hypothetical protein
LQRSSVAELSERNDASREQAFAPMFSLQLLRHAVKRTAFPCNVA